MVTKIKREPSGSTVMKEGDNALTARSRDANDLAIKSVNETFAYVQTAAVLGMLLGVAFGRWEQFNDLFTRLKNSSKGKIYAEYIRMEFVPRVLDEYAQGGERDPEDEAKWLHKPVAFISYSSNPTANNRKENEFFLTATVKKEDDTGMARKAHIQAGRDALKEAGEEGLLALEWAKARKVTKPESVFDIGKLRDAIATVLKKAAKEVSNPDSGITAGMLRATMRDYGFDAKHRAPVEEILQANQPRLSVASNQPETELIKRDEIAQEKAA